MSAKTWNPTEEPYRVRQVRRSGLRELHGWSDSVRTFATEEEAREAFDAPLQRGVLEVQLHVAENAAEWSKRGRWRSLDSRKR